MSGPSVSVVIPVYNGELFLWEALESVAWQTRPADEIIAVDDGSTDGSVAVMRCFRGVTCIVQTNAGVSAARNTGIARARGEIIALLDADDIWTPDKLERQVAALVASPGDGYSLGHHREFAEPGFDVSFFTRPETFGQAAPSPIPSSWVVWQETFARVGAFDPEFSLSEDAEWLLRAKDKDVSVAWVHDVLLLRRLHGANLTGNVEQSRIALLKALRASVERRRVAKRLQCSAEHPPAIGWASGGTTE